MSSIRSYYNKKAKEEKEIKERAQKKEAAPSSKSSQTQQTKQEQTSGSTWSVRSYYKQRANTARSIRAADEFMASTDRSPVGDLFQTLNSYLDTSRNAAGVTFDPVNSNKAPSMAGSVPTTGTTQKTEYGKTDPATLSARLDELKDRQVELRRFIAGTSRGGQRDMMERYQAEEQSVLAEISALQEELEWWDDTGYDSCAEELYNATANAEKALTATRDNGKTITKDLEDRQATLSGLEYRLNQMEAAFDENPTAELAAEYRAAAAQYQQLANEYNTLYAEYEPLADQYTAAYDAYNAFVEQYKDKIGQPRDATLLDMTWNSFWRGYYQSRYGEESSKLMQGRENEADEYKKMLEGDEYQFEADNWLSQMISGSMEQLGQRWRQTSNPDTLAAMGGAGLAAFVAGQAGPQVAAPEEIITVPSAMATAYATASALSNLNIEAGLAYQEMLEQGISPETAGIIAPLVGGGNAALEGLQVDELIKGLKVFNNKDGYESVADLIWSEIKRRFPNVANQVLQEDLQELTTIAGTQVGSKLDKGKWAYDTGEVLERLGETTMSSALTFSAMDAPGAVMNVTANKANINRLDNIGKDYQPYAADVVNEGLTYDPDSEAHKAAQAVKEKLDAGETVSNAEIGRVVVENERAKQEARQIGEANGIDADTVDDIGLDAALEQAAREAAGAETAQEATKVQNASGQQKTARPNKGEAAEVIKVLSDNIPALKSEQPVAKTSAQAFRAAPGSTMAERARKLFEGIKGIVVRPGFGDVEINGRSVKDDLSHGVGPAKAATISVVPQVIQNGKQIDYQENWKGRGYDGYVFAAPVEMDGETVYVAAVVKKTSKNRFYLHEVVDSNGNIIKIDDGESANPTSLATNGDAGTLNPSPKSDSTIPHAADSVNTAEAQLRGDILAGAQNTLGAEGYRVFAAEFSKAEDDPVDAFRELAKAYNEGMANRRSTGSNLTAAQYNAMFEAGRKDAEASVRAQVEQSGTAVVHKGKSGIDYTDAATREYVASNVNKKTVKVLDTVAKALGIRVRFADTVDGGAANAQIENGIVTIEKGNPNPVRFLFGHEITHRMQELAPAEYARLREAVLAGGWADAAIRDVQSQYASHGRSITNEAALDEAVANYVGQLLEDSGELERFVARNQGDRGMLQKLRDAIRDLRKRLRGNEYYRQLKQVEQRLSEALKASAEQAKVNSQQTQKNTARSGEVRYSIKEIDGRLMPVIDTQNDTRNFDVAEAFLTSLISAENPFSTILYDAQPVYVGKDLPSEYRSSEYTKGMISALKTVKMQAATNLDEMLLLAYNGSWEENKKAKHAVDAKNGWYRYETEFAVPILDHKKFSHYTIYGATLLIRNDADGKSYLYDMIDLNEKKKVNNSAPSRSGVLESDPSSNGRIAQPEDVVKAESNTSFDTEVMRDTKTSLKGSASLAREIARVQKEGAASGRSDAEIEADIRAAVDEVYRGMIEDYGAMKPGEEPFRDVQVPKKTAADKRVSQTVRTILEGRATPEEALPAIEKMVAEGAFSYDIYTDRQAIADAERRIRRVGWAQSISDWMDAMRRGEVSKANTATGWALYNNAANSGDMETAMTVLDAMVKHQRSAAQVLQATRILKKLSPETQLYQVQRSVESLQEELNERYGEKDAPELKVNEALAERFVRAKTQEERDALMKDIYRDIGRQMPSRFADKWNAWRYLAMMGNARTHIRNIVGNAGFTPVVAVKNLTATAIESAVSRVSGGKLERTKSVVGLGEGDRALLKAAWDDYAKVQEAAMSGGKYDDFANANKYIEEGRVVFRSKALDKARKGNSRALDAEDIWFSKPHYAAALASYCKAHGITAEMLQADNKGQKKTATRGGQAMYSVQGNPYQGKNLSDDPSVYTWEFLTSLPDMKTIVLPEVPSVRDEAGRIDTGKVVADGMKNARNAGTEQNGKVLVQNKYTGKRIQVTGSSIRHGLNGASNRLLTNARLGAVIGDVVQNAVPINALNDKAKGVSGTYAMAAYAADSNGREFIAIITVEQYGENVIGVETYDVAHAVSGRQKKSSQADTKSQGFDPIKAAVISISDLLKVVKETHQSILSGDVLAHLGETRNPNGDYAGKVKFSMATVERPVTQAKAPHVDRVLLDRARAYAIKEAQKATYRDTNAFSQTVSELGRSFRLRKNPVGKSVGIVADGILPFRKTPANVLARGMEYSPLGFLQGIKWAAWDVKKGNKTGAEAIDRISAGLTGTGLLALGIYMAAQGLVRGHGDEDEKENEYQELMGHQAYAMELPDGTSITLDWLAPECLPFFIGVNLWEQTEGKRKNLTLAAILTSVGTVTEPLLEMSCLQSLNDVFDAVGYAASGGLDGLPAALASAATSYLTQALPTILGQAERTGEGVRMSTYTEKNAFLTSDMQYTLGRASARLPGLEYQQIPYIDAWGRTEATGSIGTRAFNNFLNPAYISRIESSDMEEELLRLYEETGEGGVLPSRAAKYFNVNGERKDLTAEEYVDYATKKGQTAYSLLTALTGSSAYKAMSDAEKAEAVSKCYEYANATAKAAISDYAPEGWVEKAIRTCKATGVKPEKYVTLYLQQKEIEALKDADGDTITNSKGLQIMQMIYNTSGLTDKQRQALFEDFGVGKSIRHYNRTLVEQKLTQMRKQAR